nr:hypothetical protein [Sphingomonas sp. Y57]
MVDVDILVNNAPHRPKVDLMEMSVESWDRVHAVNARDTFRCMRGRHGLRPEGPDHDARPAAARLGPADPAGQRDPVPRSPASSYMTGHVMAVDGGYLVG